MRPVVFSASSVNAYHDCHLRWWFSYVLQQEGEQSEAQAVGIAVHSYAEQMLRGKQEAELEDGLPLGTLLPLFTVFDRDILPTYREPVLIEASFEITVNGIPFSGIIDAVDRHDVGFREPYKGVGEIVYANILRDLKTTGSRPSAGKYRFNMIGYWLGAADLGYQPDMMQLDYIVRTKQPYYWPEAVQPPDDDDLAWFAATLERAAEGVARSDYEPTGLGTYVCGYCPHRAVCGPYQRYKEVIDG